MRIGNINKSSYTNEPLDCSLCGGKGWIIDTQGAVVQCTHCYGIGKEPINPEQQPSPKGKGE